MDGYLFRDSGPFTNVPDVTLIIGSDGIGSYASILLCRFHKLAPSLSGVEKENLFLAAWYSLKSTKFECRRSGGSSGLTSSTPKNVMSKFISTPGTTPRFGKGSIWIRGRETWFVYYIGTYDGKVKKVKYSNPVPGGSFKLKPPVLEKHSFLLDFISIKPITARIVEAIQIKILNNNKIGVWITPQAVAREVMNITKTEMVLSCSQNGTTDRLPSHLKSVPHQLLRRNRKLVFYTIYNRDHVNYTMVCHPVGFHQDHFLEDKPTLENKVCFEMHQSRIPKKLIHQLYPNGRGGGESSTSFVFAILDW